MNYIPQLKWILISVINECYSPCCFHLYELLCRGGGVKYDVFWENQFLMELCFSNQTFYL